MFELSINVLKGLYFITTAWNRLNSVIVNSCLIKPGFKKTEGYILQDYNPEDPLFFTLLSELMRHAISLKILKILKPIVNIALLNKLKKKT